MVLDLRLMKVGCRDDNQFFLFYPLPVLLFFSLSFFSVENNLLFFLIQNDTFVMFPCYIVNFKRLVYENNTTCMLENPFRYFFFNLVAA